VVLAKAYHTKWSGFYQDEAILEEVRNAIDVHAKRQVQLGAPGLMFSRNWYVHGFIARAYARLGEQFEDRGWLEETVTVERPDGTMNTLRRRRLYGDLFHEAFEWRLQDRRHYTNQVVNCAENMYYTQSALRKLGDDRALSETEARWYVREAAGLEPLRTRKFAIEGDAKGFPFRNRTPKGTTREVGYTHAYEWSYPKQLARTIGSETLKNKGAQGLDTRFYFRVPANQSNGDRTFRDIGSIGWRGRSYPGKQKEGVYRMAANLQSASGIRHLQLDPQPVNPDNVPGNVAYNPMLPIYDYEDYTDFLEMNETDHRVPTEPQQQEDYVFADEQVGVYTFKHGEDLIHGTFFYDLPPAGDWANIRNRGRLRHSRPDHDRLVDVTFETRFPDTGPSVEVEHPWGIREYKSPPAPPGNEWPDRPLPRDRREGLAYFYKLHYGDYLIGMNTTQKGTYREQAYELEIPNAVDRAVDVQTGESVAVNEPLEIGPTTTRVLSLNKGGTQ
jgi:hypothetical protein